MYILSLGLWKNDRNEFRYNLTRSGVERPTIMTRLPAVLHACAALHHWFGIFYACMYLMIPLRRDNERFAALGQSKYLTFWDMCLQAVYFTICLVNDFAGSNDIQPRHTPLIRRVKDYMLCSVGFPVAMFVGLTFWGLYAVDRELVFPKALDPFFPNWLNHVMHTNIMIFTAFDIIICFRKYPTRSQGLGGLTAFMCIYLIWTHIIYFYSGAWVYPILEVLNWGQRVIFFLGLLLFVNALYLLGEFLNKMVWVKELRQIQPKESSRRKKQ